MQLKNCTISRYYFRLKQSHSLFIHGKSNYPANILKQLPISIETRLSNFSSNPKIFYEASKHYKNIFNQAGYDYKYQYKPSSNKNAMKIEKETSRSTRPSKNISNNMGKYFLLLIQKHFLNNQKYQKIFTKNNLKVSYSCMDRLVNYQFT